MHKSHIIYSDEIGLEKTHNLFVMNKIIADLCGDK